MGKQKAERDKAPVQMFQMFKTTKSRKYNIDAFYSIKANFRDFKMQREAIAMHSCLRGVGGRGEGSEIERNTNQSFTPRRVVCLKKQQQIRH